MANRRGIERRAVLGMMGAAAGMQGQEPLGMPADGPAPAGPARADSGSVFPLLERLGEKRPFTSSFLNNRYTSVDDYRREGRRAVLAALGPAPATVSPKAELADRQDLGTFIRERIAFSTTPEFRVPAYVHIPKNRHGRLPAIVDLHSHGGMFLFGKEKVIDFGRNHPAMTEYHQVNYAGRPTATELVRRGYVVITIDAFPFGERRIVMDEDLENGWDRHKMTVDEIRLLNQKCRQKESTVVKTLAYVGMTWPGVVAWDDMRTVDYLVTREEVDPERIGCIGVSMGGYRSLLLAGLDDRIRAGCVAGFMSTVRPMMRRHMDTHSFVHFIPHLHGSLDLPDVVALRAPKPLMVQQCRRDGLFPPEGMTESVEKLAAIYRKAGAPNAFAPRWYDLGHILNVEMQDEAFSWFDRILKG